MPFKKGENGGGHGGARPGAGRPPDGLRAMCKELLSKKELVQRLAKFGAGERIQQVVTDDGEEIPVPANANVQVKAIEVLLDRAYGKPDQSFNTNITGQTINVAELAGVAARIAEILAIVDGGDRVGEGK